MATLPFIKLLDDSAQVESSSLVYDESTNFLLSSVPFEFKENISVESFHVTGSVSCKGSQSLVSSVRELSCVNYEITTHGAEGGQDPGIMNFATNELYIYGGESIRFDFNYVCFTNLPKFDELTHDKQVYIGDAFPAQEFSMRYLTKYFYRDGVPMTLEAD